MAFFSPREKTLEALLRVPALKLVVSEEFTINNPYKLEKLTNAELLSIPPDPSKLHAKVLIAKMKDGSDRALLGSANFTGQGMGSNQEACIVLESGNPEDKATIAEIRAWFTALFGRARALDFVRAKSIFDQRSRYRLEPREKSTTPEKSEYWALKTTSGSTGEDHWPQFWDESIIAIGWEQLSIDPFTVSDAELHKSLRDDYDYHNSGQVKSAASTMNKFMSLKKDTIILLCRGYVSKQKRDVYIHGFARVTGPFRADPFCGSKWRFKHNAVIQKIEMSLPRDTVAAALEKGTLRNVMHELNEKSMNRISLALDVPIQV